LVAAVVAVLSLLSVLAAAAYSSVFGVRYEPGPEAPDFGDYPGLSRTAYPFPSDGGRMLSGYLYHGGTDPKALVVLSHGIGGGGHLWDLSVIDYLAGRGYAVFAYDGTGNGESEGRCVYGLPQGLIDLDHALGFVGRTPGLRDLPVVLFGHSWGGWCAAAVPALHPEVRAVVSVSGFDRVSDMVLYDGRQLAGPLAYAMAPLVGIYERARFGPYAGRTGVDGLGNTDAGVLVVHGTEDVVVPPEYGYGRYLDLYGDDPRFRFVQLEGQGHDCYVSGDVLAMVADFYDEYVLEGG